jgi:hypothetical protein
MKPSHRIFFAIPFDSATKKLYERVASCLRQRYKTLSTIIGNEEVGPSPPYSSIASFKAQNRELTDQFVSQIQRADVVVADLTHNNPNVHVELGIALFENKNILRVTGRSETELGFDIRNLEVRKYQSDQDLLRILTDYLDTFFQIKQLAISKKFPSLYGSGGPFRLEATKPGKPLHLHPSKGIWSLLRDGAVKATFEILNTVSPNDWFGIYFRADAGMPLLSSHLVYVRQNGKVEVAVYPGPEILDGWSVGSPISGRETILIEFENDHLDIQIHNARFTTEKLFLQKIGRIFFAAWNADVHVKAVKMICRDTIDFQ